MARATKEKAAIHYGEWETPAKTYGSSSDESDDQRPLKKLEAKKAKPSAKAKAPAAALDPVPSKKKRPLEAIESKKAEPAKKADAVAKKPEKRPKASPKSPKSPDSFASAVEEVLLSLDGDKDSKTALKKLRRDYAELSSLRQTEPEKLLEESRKLAKAEADAHDKAASKMKQEIANLTKKLDKYERMREDLERAKSKQDAKSASSSEFADLKQKFDQLRAENTSLRLQLEETQAEQPALSANASVSEMHAKLAHTNKLLRMYELVTSMHMTLKKDGDVQEVACRVTDSLRAQQFAFELAIPANPRKQIDYLPSPEEVAYHKRQADATAPAYLLEDLSFSRSELTRFMRTMLDAVIRKPT
ncbi:hypothetical protein SDRG_01794 [Saprolegnia diclina VS20]|uniref:Monopolin complex subunit Csm1/Pcs1 C-terminal domain-containing protein n=1 Tax=Saprolegnia diclina (strain VS20) TaxID=1156394 RepID=T0SCW7_SAPDV|nr:hypothetical protein SDRG_01794 [Saprolegnia diclina VS20]EQC40722.1 hypothetical protein SDRG_01794 [Saprolegnia diclina VS20]|eukprot:XP_008605566.1 hypothetical protein SDRG_01794 [Saprolegnia diclina VS20]